MCYLSMQAITTLNPSNLIHNLISRDLAIPVLLKTFRDSVQSFQHPWRIWLYLSSLKPLWRIIEKYRGRVVIILVRLEVRSM